MEYGFGASQIDASAEHAHFVSQHGSVSGSNLKQFVRKSGTASYTTAMNPAKAENPSNSPGLLIPASGGANRDTLTFAQLSDPHLSSPSSVKLLELLNKRVLGYLSWCLTRRYEHDPGVLRALLQDMAGRKPDHVVITGDLTHLGLVQECQQVSRWLASLGKPADVTVIPGNHDTYVRASWQETLKLWEPYMVSDAHTQAPVLDKLFPSLRVRGPVALIGLSSARPSLPFLAVGSLGARQLRKLAELLEQTGRQKLFRVVLVHHAPVPASDRWRKRLTDGGALCRVLMDHGVELVLHGHTHRAMESELRTAKGVAPVIGLPSASALGRGHGQPACYHVYRISRNGQGWDLSIEARGYVRDKAAFAAAGQRRIQIPA